MNILQILQIVVHSYTPSGRFFNHVATVSDVLLNLAGLGNFVTSASCTLGVFMELAVNHGSVTVSLSGEEFFVIKVTIALDLKLSFLETLRFSLTIIFGIAPLLVC